MNKPSAYPRPTLVPSRLLVRLLVTRAGLELVLYFLSECTWGPLGLYLGGLLFLLVAAIHWDAAFLRPPVSVELSSSWTRVHGLSAGFTLGCALTAILVAFSRLQG